MVLEAIGWGLTAGVVATVGMVLVEVPAWRRWGLPGVMEWQENQAIAERLLGRPRGELVAQGLAFHFLHGALAGVVFVLGVPFLPVRDPLLALGLLFGFALWAITLGIHGPITGTPPGRDPLGRRALAVSLAGHLIYGAVLAVLVGGVV